MFFVVGSLLSLFYQDEEIEFQRSKLIFSGPLGKEVAKLNLDSRSADLD